MTAPKGIIKRSPVLLYVESTKVDPWDETPGAERQYRMIAVRGDHRAVLGDHYDNELDAVNQLADDLGMARTAGRIPGQLRSVHEQWARVDANVLAISGVIGRLIGWLHIAVASWAVGRKGTIIDTSGLDAISIKLQDAVRPNPNGESMQAGTETGPPREARRFG